MKKKEINGAIYMRNESLDPTEITVMRKEDNAWGVVFVVRKDGDRISLSAKDSMNDDTFLDVYSTSIKIFNGEIELTDVELYN